MANASSDDHNDSVTQKVHGNGDHMHDLYDSKAFHKNKMNVHLQPLDHNPHTRNSSVPPSGNQYGANGQLSTPAQSGAPHPLNFAPSPNQRGGNQIRLQSIDHTQHQI